MLLSERIPKLLERWFLNEPLLFQIACMHDFVENSNMHCVARCGKRRIEYNPAMLEGVDDKCLDEVLRTEILRLLLLHPYSRRPDYCCDMAVVIGSNITIADNYSYSGFNIDKPEDYNLVGGQSYEWYSSRIQEMLPPLSGAPSPSNDGDLSDSQDNNAYNDIAALWEEDEYTCSTIRDIVASANHWGSVSSRVIELVKASKRVKINWRDVLAGFRSSILSTKRRLTRMRPNRRYGYETMGSMGEFTTRLLIAVDVSGSINSSDLSRFFGLVNNAFKYGFQSIDVLQFDSNVTSVDKMKKVKNEIVATGRGGTNFQPAIDYAIYHSYDGVLILTDGQAPEPVLPKVCKTKLAWVCTNRQIYEKQKGWMRKYGRVCVLES